MRDGTRASIAKGAGYVVAVSGYVLFQETHKSSDAGTKVAAFVASLLAGMAVMFVVGGDALAREERADEDRRTRAAMAAAAARRQR